MLCEQACCASGAPDQFWRVLTGLYDHPRVHVMVCAVSDTATASLSKPEAEAVVDVSGKRRREFATARLLARVGFARFFNVHGFDLLNAADRSPIWPLGIQGSISHSDESACIAMVDASYGTVGIDIEARRGLREDLWRLTLRKEEIESLESLGVADKERRALAVFSAKEAVFKAQFPRSGSFMDFMALRVQFQEGDTLRCTFQQSVGPFPRGFVVQGRWRDEGELVTAAWIPSR